MGKLQENKLKKRQALLDAAYELFMEQGAGKTSIDNIVTRARVAKGTFYLYFADKDAIAQALIWRISEGLFDQALAHVKTLGQVSFTEKVLALADCLLEELSHNVFALRLIRHNLKWPRADELQEDGELHPLFAKVYGVVRSCPEMAGCDELELYRWLTAIVSMCVSVCYGCMVEQRPGSLEEMKPVLFRIITHSLGSEGGSCDGSAADSIRGSVPE